MKKSKQISYPNSQSSLFQIAEIQLSYHPHFKATERPQISQSMDAYTILSNNWNMETIELKEDFKLLLLNRANRVLGIYEVSSGGMAGTVVDPKLIFGIALKAGASYLVLSHNHPSGNLKPSTEDIAITKKLEAAGKLLDLLVIDHIIITKSGYLSFQDEGLM
jgi:DNA repair protein RadC